VPALSLQEIAALELELGCTLPIDVRERYEAADGYLGPTNCNFLYPYHALTDTQLIRVNTVLKSQEWFPTELRKVAILGDDGCGNHLCFDPVKQQAFKWHPVDGEWRHEVFPSMTELWAYVRRQYESAA
jgi:hypothetical protein